MNKNPEFDTIVLQVPRGTKSMWVRESQRKGQKLNRWIYEQVQRPWPFPSSEGAMPMTKAQQVRDMIDNTPQGVF